MDVKAITSRLRRFWIATLRFVFHDEVRLLEIFSALNLLAWADLLNFSPEVLTLEAYRGFDGVNASVWAGLFACVGAWQIGCMIPAFGARRVHRFIGLAFAAGAWAVITLNFWKGGVATTANFNYFILALGCAVSGAWLAWTTNSYNS